MRLLVISLLVLASSSSISSCPAGCTCEPKKMICSGGNLIEFPKNLSNYEVEELDLSSNMIENIDEDSFPSGSKIRNLDLRNNKLSNLSHNMFKNLGDLTTLGLAGNRIEHIDEDAFPSGSKIRSLRLNGNRLSNLSRNMFKNLGNLTTLDLEGNMIEHIEEHAFPSGSKIATLDLRNNKLSNLSRNMFKNLGNMAYLNLEGNMIKHIEEYAFPSGNKIVILSLMNNSLSDIRPNTFKNLGSLRHLYLEGNRIEHIEEHAFPSGSKIVNLFLMNNSLSDIRPNTFKNLGSLKQLRLDGNPLRCTCNMFELMKSALSFRVIGNCKQINGSEMHLSVIHTLSSHCAEANSFWYNIDQEIEAVLDLTNNGSSIPKSKAETMYGALDNITIQVSERRSNSESANRTARIIQALERLAETVELDSTGVFEIKGQMVSLKVLAIEQLSGAQNVSISDVPGLYAEFPADLVDAVKTESWSSRLRFIIYNSGDLFQVFQDNETKQDLNSAIISISIGQQKITGLKTPVKMMFQHRKQAVANNRMNCSFWNWTSLSWSIDGLSINEQTDNYTECMTTHFTDFALLINPELHRPEGDRINLSIITYVCGSLSLLGLLLTIIGHCSIKKLRTEKSSKVLVNLCAAVAILNLAFLSLKHVTVENGVTICKVAAVIIHYSLLASFCWSVIEAFHMYISLVKVFCFINRVILKYMLAGWGLPAVIVAITLSIGQTENYGFINDQLCWLQKDALYSAVLTPLGVMLCLNITAFIMVLKQLHTASTHSGLQVSRPLTSQTQQRQIFLSKLKGAFSVFLMLGLTWVFAVLVVHKTHKVVEYLFTILISCQGFMIFVFTCLLRPEIRKSIGMTISGITRAVYCEENLKETDILQMERLMTGKTTTTTTSTLPLIRTL